MKFHAITPEEALPFGIEAQTFPFPLEAELAPVASADVFLLRVDLHNLNRVGVDRFLRQHCIGNPKRLVVFDPHSVGDHVRGGDFWSLRSIFRAEDINEKLIPWPLEVDDFAAAVEHSPLTAQPPRKKATLIGPWQSSALIPAAINVAKWMNKKEVDYFTHIGRIEAEIDVDGYKSAKRGQIVSDLDTYPRHRLIQSFENARATIACQRFHGGNLPRRALESASAGRPCIFFGRAPLPMAELGADYSWLNVHPLEDCALAGQIVARDRHLDFDDPGINAKARACWDQFLAPSAWPKRLPQLLEKKLAPFLT